MDEHVTAVSAEEISGTVERVLFQNAENGYTVLRLSIPGTDAEITAVGCFPGAAPGENMTLLGNPSPPW